MLGRGLRSLSVNITFPSINDYTITNVFTQFPPVSLVVNSLRKEPCGAGRERLAGLFVALAEDLDSTPRTQKVAHNHPWLQFWGIWCPLLTSLGTRHAHATLTCKQNIHTHKINKPKASKRTFILLQWQACCLYLLTLSWYLSWWIWKLLDPSLLSPHHHKSLGQLRETMAFVPILWTKKLRITEVRRLWSSCEKCSQGSLGTLPSCKGPLPGSCRAETDRTNSQGQRTQGKASIENHGKGFFVPL